MSEHTERRSSCTHDLKTWPPYFAAILDGRKPFEVRRNDRDFRVGDVLRLREWDPADRDYTGQFTTRTVTYLLPGGRFGVSDGHVVMGLSRSAPDEIPARNQPLPDADGGGT